MIFYMLYYIMLKKLYYCWASLLTCKWLLLFLVLSYTATSSARMQFGMSAGLTNDSNSLDSKVMTSASFFDGYFYVSLFEKGKLLLGLGYGQLNMSDTGTDSSSVQMLASHTVIGLKYLIGETNTYFLQVAGTPLSQATFKVAGLETELWTGSTLIGLIGIRPKIAENFHFTAALQYVTANYVTKVSSDTGTSSSDKTSFTRTFISPALGLEFDF